MKRFILLIVLVMIAARMIGHHRPRIHAGDHRRASLLAFRDGESTRVDGPICDDEDCSLRANAPVHRHPPSLLRTAEAAPAAVETPPPSWLQGEPIADRPGLVIVQGPPSMTEIRAEQAARRRLEQEVANRLSPDVPRSWKAPAPLIDPMIVDRTIQPEERDYGDRYTLYRAAYRVDFSAENVSRIVEAYHREVVGHRLMMLGGGLVFVMACLAAVSGYIRADEATKGYYTNRLRLAAAVGVGAAGMAVYRFMA